jgi:hypothetical protein
VVGLALIAMVYMSTAGAPGDGALLGDPASSRCCIALCEGMPCLRNHRRRCSGSPCRHAAWPGAGVAARGVSGSAGCPAQGLQTLTVVGVGCRYPRWDGQTAAIDDEVGFCPLLPRSVGFGPVRGPL